MKVNWPTHLCLGHRLLDQWTVRVGSEGAKRSKPKSESDVGDTQLENSADFSSLSYAQSLCFRIAERGAQNDATPVDSVPFSCPPLPDLSIGPHDGARKFKGWRRTIFFSINLGLWTWDEKKMAVVGQFNKCILLSLLTGCRHVQFLE